METADIVLATSLVISLCAVIMLAIQAPLQRRELARIADRSRLDLITVVDEISSVAMRMEALEHSVQRLTKRIDQMQLSQRSVPNDYGDALELIRAGACTEQLVAQCGLSRGEAELLRRLHHPVAA